MTMKHLPNTLLTSVPGSWISGTRSTGCPCLSLTATHRLRLREPSLRPQVLLQERRSTTEPPFDPPPSLNLTRNRPLIPHLYISVVTFYKSLLPWCTRFYTSTFTPSGQILSHRRSTRHQPRFGVTYSNLFLLNPTPHPPQYSPNSLFDSSVLT